MDVPGIVQSSLADADDETVVATVHLKGDDALFVTPTRTLLYRADGLLSDESVEEYPHDAHRIEVGEGRRKATIRLDYGVDGERSFGVPPGALDEALHPVIAGVLNAAGAIEPGETVVRTFRFSELTLVVTSARVFKHVGAAVWDDEFEEVAFADVTGLDLEDGTVASQLVLETSGRAQRVKTPTARAQEVYDCCEEALLAYHDVSSYEAFRERIDAEEADGTGASDEPAAADDATTAPDVSDDLTLVNDELDPLDTGGDGDQDGDTKAGSTADDLSASGPTAESAATETAGVAVDSEDGEVVEVAEVSETDSVAAADAADARDDGENASDDGEDGASTDGFADSGFESAVAVEPADREAVEQELRALYQAIDRQRELLDRQQRAVEELAEALIRDR